MPTLLKSDAMPKLLNAINDHQFKQWTTYSADSREVAILAGEVAVLGSLFWELSNLIEDVDIYERAGNKEVYAKFTEILTTRFNAENEYGYADSSTVILPKEGIKDNHRVRWVGALGQSKEDLKNGCRNGVEWVERELAKMVIMP